jgi:hypothetical protein
METPKTLVKQYYAQDIKQRPAKRKHNTENQKDEQH